MSDSLHFSGPRVQISAPNRPWETVTYKVNEGPVGFVRGGRTFVAYSASACWDTSYAVGLLTNTSGKPARPRRLDQDRPHFKWHSGVKANASFIPVQTQDGSEDWFLFHSNTAGCDPARVLRAQRMFWDPDGSPELRHQPGYVEAVDGIGMEDLFFRAHDQPCDQDWCQENLADARALKAAGKFVLAVDYAKQRANVERACARYREEGFAGYVSRVELDRVAPPC